MHSVHSELRRVLAVPSWVGLRSRIFPVCAFHILSKGCSSHGMGFFLLKAVEKVRGTVGYTKSQPKRSLDGRPTGL